MNKQDVLQLIIAKLQIYLGATLWAAQNDYRPNN